MPRCKIINLNNMFHLDLVRPAIATRPLPTPTTRPLVVEALLRFNDAEADQP